MRTTGEFSLNKYLNEAAENMNVPDDGMIIPDTNKKTYDWLKSEFQKGKVEVKVEMKMGSSKFEPGYSTEGAKNFKPELKTSAGSMPKIKVEAKTTPNVKSTETKDKPTEKKEVKKPIKEEDKEEDKEEKTEEKKTKVDESYGDDMNYSLYDMLLELETWFNISDVVKKKAAESGINDLNNRTFAKLLEDWKDGVYDEDPDYLLNELLNLIDL